jgi:hypothetical protein
MDTDEVVEVLQNTGPVIKYFGIIYNSNTYGSSFVWSVERYEKEKRGKYGVKYGPDRAKRERKIRQRILRAQTQNKKEKNGNTKRWHRIKFRAAAASPSILPVFFATAAQVQCTV